jgi:hypothetical protein
VTEVGTGVFSLFERDAGHECREMSSSEYSGGDSRGRVAVDMEGEI